MRVKGHALKDGLLGYRYCKCDQWSMFRPRQGERGSFMPELYVREEYRAHLEEVVDGQRKQWLANLFEFENCDECGRGAEGHTAVGVLGNWFARCNIPKPGPCPVCQDCDCEVKSKECGR
jgi:hypothetical protein